MKINNILLVLISLLILIISLSSVAAVDNIEGNISATAEDSNNDLNQAPIEDIQNDDNSQDNKLSSSNDEELLSGGKVIVVDDEGYNHNEMSSSTIQKAINSANAGDTIIINGRSYVHCHFIVDKKLTIKSNVNTVMTPCSSKVTSNHQGIFYIDIKASGTVIEGFTFKDDAMYTDNEGYGIFIKGASDVIIRNCNVTTEGVADSIRLENANNCLIDNVNVFNSVNGINIKNSKATTIRNSVINNNYVGIAVGEGCSGTTIISNNITGNTYAGVSMTSANNVNVISNQIVSNGFGVYVNCYIDKVVVNGNFFNKNRIYDVFNDYRTVNLAGEGGEKLEVVNNNYMIGHNDRPVYNKIYKDVGKNNGRYEYDAVNDVYIDVGQGNGRYEEVKDAVFLGYVFAINEYLDCPVIYYTYGKKSWSQSGDYFLRLTDIIQVEKGTYSISIVDADGNIATDLSSVYVTFYLNKNNTAVTPQEGDVYKTVLMKNGTATVTFDREDFKESGNVLTASFPGIENNIYENPYKQFSILDDQIPWTKVKTTITISNLNTYPKSGQYLIATLRDAKGNPLSGKTIYYDIVSKTYTTKTDSKGQARLPINLNEGTYPATVRFEETNDYYASSAKATVYVKKINTQIISSNINMVPNVAEYFKLTLKDASGNGIANQKVVITVNGKSYTRTTDSKGQAGITLKFSIQKTYKLTIKYAGTNKYKSCEKVNRLPVFYSSKVAKLSVPKVTIPPKTNKDYSIYLRDDSGKGIPKETVTLTLNGETCKRTTNADGLIVVKLNFKDPKTYKITVNYPGSKIYKATSASNSIVVEKIKTSFSASNMEVNTKTQKTYTATLKTSSGNALANQKVTFTLDGKNYEKTTNSKGQASITVNMPNEKEYSIVLTYKGTDIYAGTKLTKTIKVQKIATSLTGSDHVFSRNSNPSFEVILKDASGNALANQKITFTFNAKDYAKTTDSSGLAKVDIPSDTPATISIVSKFAGNDKYKAVSKTNTVTISNKTNTIFVNPGLSCADIQELLDACNAGDGVEFLGSSYSDVALTVDKALNIYSNAGTVLNGKAGSPVFTVSASGTNISNLAIVSDENSGIVIDNANSVNIINNSISNKLNSSKMDEYLESTLPLPGYGVSIVNSEGVNILNNNVSLFESAIFAENSSDLLIEGNCLFENNYGIKYGYGVSDTEITANEIVNNIGLYTMEVPEGPRGYGIFLNNSAVDVTITNNVIDWNHLGISVDANYSTGIVIKSNHISDNVLEGIRFNAGYDLAENAAEPIVTNNAIYRNARGPSMMILGELSANPGGIYAAGEWNESQRLKLGSNWYGKNALVTWDYETGVVGWGTMCPRISTTPIAFDKIEYVGSGKYSVTFYKDGEIASDLPQFDLYARLNNKAEVNFNVVNGVGYFSFDSSDYTYFINTIDISVGSLNDLYRYYTSFYSCKVTKDGEIQS